MLEEYKADAKNFSKVPDNTPIPPTVDTDTRTATELMNDKKSVSQRVNDILKKRGMHKDN
jgi:hypothetical protein